MATTKTKKINDIRYILKELREIKNYLRKILMIIPEESLNEYENKVQIKKAYLKALKLFPSSFKKENHSTLFKITPPPKTKLSL